MGSPESERPKGNVIKKVAKIGIPVAILVSQAACGTPDINFPPCDTDPSPKTTTVTLGTDYIPGRKKIELSKVSIEKITMYPVEYAGRVRIDQSKQPEGHRIEILPDGRMEFRSTNGRTYSISLQPIPYSGRTELTVQADCETTPKTDS